MNYRKEVPKLRNFEGSCDLSHVYLQTLSPTSYTRRDNFWTPVDTVESLENLSNLSTSWFAPLPFKACKNKFV